MPTADPKRNSTFEDAVAKFTGYIDKYPQAPDLENAIFSRAVAEYQLRKFDDAIKDLELNLQRFPQSSTLSKSKNLLAVTLATQGSALLVTGDASAKTKAFELYKRATDYLRDIIKKREDVALINEANFQLGEILLNQAAYSPESERPATLRGSTRRVSCRRSDATDHSAPARQTKGIRGKESRGLASQQRHPKEATRP